METKYYQKDGVIRVKADSEDLRLYSINNHKLLVNHNKNKDLANRLWYELNHDLDLHDTYMRLINESCGIYN